jgi:hypothetical protein
MRIVNLWFASTALWLSASAALPALADEQRAREPAGWDVRLAPPGEPGDRFEMSGTVRDAKGELLPGAKLFIYHADAHGKYASGSASSLHLAATLRADEKGRYRIRSVFPGQYGGVAPHVHFEFLDPSLGASEIRFKRKGSKEGPADAVVVSRADDGVWRVNVNLTVHRMHASGNSPGANADLRSRAAADSAKWKEP